MRRRFISGWWPESCWDWLVASVSRILTMWSSFWRNARSTLLIFAPYSTEFALLSLNWSRRSVRCLLIRCCTSVVISAAGVSLDPAKLRVLANWPTPTTVREMQSFLKFVKYYGDYISDVNKLHHCTTWLLCVNVTSRLSWQQNTSSHSKILNDDSVQPPDPLTPASSNRLYSTQ